MIHLQPTKKKRIRKPSFWKSVRVGLSPTDLNKLERYATDHKIAKPTALRQLIRTFADFDHSEDMVLKVNTVFELVYGFSHLTLNIKSSERKYTDYRHAHRYWLKSYTKLTLKEIGLMSNFTDYSNVLHSLNEYPKICKQLPHLRDNHELFRTLMQNKSEPKFTISEVLKAAERGEVNMIDAEHICNLLMA